ncbi:MAG: PAS domain S-box protein [Candidatus Woesearchaeota archaeon]
MANSIPLEIIERLKNNKCECALLLDIVGTVIVALDEKGNIILANKKACEILGYKMNELIGKNWFKTCIPKNEMDGILKVFEKCMKKGGLVEVHENNILTKNGEVRLVRWNNTTLTKGNSIVGTISSGEDITEIRAAMEEIKKRNNELERINKLTMDREIKMIELKKRIAFLESKIKGVKN